MRILIFFILINPFLTANELAINKGFNPTAIERSNAIVESILKARQPGAYEVMMKTKRDRQEAEDFNDAVHPAVLYLTSSSVPPRNAVEVALETSNLKAQYPGLVFTQVFRGMDASMIEYTAAMRDAVNDKTPEAVNKIMSTATEYRFSPKLFKEVGVTEVPAVVIAKCKGRSPSPRHCTILLKASGETSLLAIASKRYGSGAAPSRLFEEHE